MIEKVNIRATGLEEFWGNKYDDYLYLWEGAKHNKPLNEIEQHKDKTFTDLFASSDEIDNALLECKNIYEKYVPILAKQLNIYHDLTLSEDFWKISFGYWFYRHICVVYEKYSYLSKIEIDKTDIKLLDRNHYYVPFDHGDYYRTFSNDFGVNQLVSEYYYLFANNQFPSVKKNYDNKKKVNKENAISEIIHKSKTLLIRILNPKVVLLDTFYSKKHYKNILKISRASILPIELSKSIDNNNTIDLISRKRIFQILTDNSFEKYLVQSFIYCLPTIFIENFKVHYNLYLKNILRSKYLFILSEGWIGNSDTAIYCAIANENGKELIFQEHASSCATIDRSFLWFYLEFENKLLTTGWKSELKNVIPGSFLAKTPEKYNLGIKKDQILFIGHTASKYLMEYSWHPSNSNYISELKVVKQIMDNIPKSLFDHFKFRPRRTPTHWDAEQTLELKNKQEIVDHGSFHKSINNSRIVIIDHLSTGIAELLLIGVPFLIIVNQHTRFTTEAQLIIDQLEKCGVLHYTSESIVDKLVKVYPRTYEWWKSKEVAKAVKNFKCSFLDTDSNTFDFLTSLLKKNTDQKL